MADAAGGPHRAGGREAGRRVPRLGPPQDLGYGRYEGWDLASPSSVHRVMARRGLLQPVRYQAQRRQLTVARREVFVDPPARRNRVWQIDFSAFETTAEGTWQLCGVADYATKLALARPVTATQTAANLITAFGDAVEAAEALQGRPLIEDCTDPVTGQITPLVIVTDNGPAMKSTAAARWFAARSHLVHVRTHHRAPWTNSVVERWIETLKYEHLYRHEIPNGPNLAAHVAAFIDEYNTVRPHQTLDWQRPLDAHQTDPNLKSKPRKCEQNT